MLGKRVGAFVLLDGVGDGAAEVKRAGVEVNAGNVLLLSGVKGVGVMVATGVSPAAGVPYGDGTFRPTITTWVDSAMMSGVPDSACCFS